jgi:hypothetical protein
MRIFPLVTLFFGYTFLVTVVSVEHRPNSRKFLVFRGRNAVNSVTTVTTIVFTILRAFSIPFSILLYIILL